MAAPHNVELEAAKFLQKLIQESTDEPRKLAAKLYVILQHMRSSGKENSIPYQVISRAMETVINQHGLDVEALNSSRLPLTGGTHMGDSSSIQFAGSSQAAAIARDSKPGISENEVANSHTLSRPPVGPSNAAHDIYQGSVSHPTSKSLDHECPSSYDTRSANSQSQERHDAASEKANQNDSKKTGGKRKRADLLSTSEAHIENSKQINTSNLNARKGKLGNKVEAPGNLSVKGNEHSQFNMVQSSGQLERILSLPNSLRSTNITNSMPWAANSKCPDEIEVSSAHSALGLQQGGPRLSTEEILSSRGGLWHQNKIGSSLEISPVPSLPSDAGSGNSTAEMLMHQSPAPLGSGASGKVHGAAPGASGSHPPAEPGIPSTMHFGSASYGSHVLVAKVNNERNREAFSASHSVELSATKPTLDPEYWKHGFTKGAVTNTSERTGEEQFYLANRGELVSSTLSTGKAFKHEGGASNALANANKIVQSGIPVNNAEMNMLKGAAPRDTGKSPISQSAGVPYMPFKEQHLKQLRAQCLVFLSFRNGMMPKKLHLEIALGNFLPKEDEPSKELIDNKGKELSINDPSNILEDTMPLGRLNNVRETEIVPQPLSSTDNHVEANFLKESEDLNMIQEIAESQAFLTKVPQPNSLRGGLTVSNHKDDLENGQEAGIANQASSVMGISKQMKPDTISWTGIGSHNESAKGSLPGSMVPHESLPERKDSAPSPSQLLPEYNIQRSRRADSHLTAFPSRELWKPISGVKAEHQTAMLVKDGNVLTKNVSEGSKYLSEDGQKNSEIQRRCIPDGIKTVLVDDIQKKGSPTVVETDQEEQDMSLDSDLPPAPKYSTSEKWIMEQQKRRLLTERNWALKQQKTERRIGTCSDKLKVLVSWKLEGETGDLPHIRLKRNLQDIYKEAVSSSEDISAKTKSVIELKKLQLLELQSRLRSDILNDFFKPIATEMDRLKSTKKNRIGRRSKQIEKFEQKMKEERQKRIRERQKEFFSEIEVHKERLDDVFKMKRERWKGFNKYVREFHKRKERILREKIDRIQREKINLLKINDVEGYLRMVKDAKSDRVMQLLKETEKYLQKLGSKLKEAKTMAGHFKADIGENQTASVFENSEIDVENEDDADQAMASYSDIKESITEQPPCLVGGKLREYQMNGLRWLVSLYNNHLNGILADEMGLGKTVQVISLICYLMESKNDRGPFLVVVPSSVLPGERILQQKFNVLLTTYEYLMNKHDRPKLSKLHWHYIIIDEGHRIKNASCKLNADLKHYHSSHRLLLTGTPLQNNLEELWALLNFLLPNIFNSSEDFSEWFNKPFESNGDNSPDEVENELPEKIERLVRCEASAYQKLLMKRVEDNLGAIGTSKGRSVHNSVIELRNICNHPYLSQLHAEQVHDFVPKHYLPNMVRLCGKLEMLDRLLPKLKATDHRTGISAWTDIHLVVIVEPLFEQFNQSGSPFFIFLLSIRAGGVGVNLQAADTVIIFDTDWNPQVDLQAQARAHRIGQKKDVLVLRLETQRSKLLRNKLEPQPNTNLESPIRALLLDFFDNNTSAEDRREYLESLLRECKKEEAAPVLDDDALNDLIARSESEIDIFEAVDRQRREEETTMWKNLVLGQGKEISESVPPLRSRLITNDDLKSFYEAIKIYEVSNPRVASNIGAKRKGQSLGGLDTQHYGRGKRAREVRSYEEQWSEEEFEKMCQADSPESPRTKEEVIEKSSPVVSSGSITFAPKIEPPAPAPTVSPQPPTESPIQQIKEVTITPPSKRGRGRPKRAMTEISPPPVVLPASSGPIKTEMASQSVTASSFPPPPGFDSSPSSGTVKSVTETSHQFGVQIAATLSTPPLPSVAPVAPVAPAVQSTQTPPSVAMQVKGQTRKTCVGAEAPRRRGKNQVSLPPAVPVLQARTATGKTDIVLERETVSVFPAASCPDSVPSTYVIKGMSKEQSSVPPGAEAPRRRGRHHNSLPPAVPVLQAPPANGKTAMIVQRETVSSLPSSSNQDSVPSSSPVKSMSNEQSSVPPSAPVLPASSETVKMDLGSEVGPISSNPMVPAPDTSPATSIIRGLSGSVLNTEVGTAPSSQPNPPFTYDTLGSPSINPSPPVPKQPKGRGRKPQSGVEAPQRRGRKRGPVAPIGADGLASGDPKSNEQQQSTAQVLPGRKSIGTSRKKVNETTEPPNVDHVQASEVQKFEGLAGLEAKPSGQPDYLAQNMHQKAFSTTSDSSDIPLDKSCSQKMDAKAQEMKGPVLEEPIVSESVADESKSLEKKKNSMLETAAAVVDQEIQMTKTDVSVKTRETNDPKLQETLVSKPAVCELETKLDAGSSITVEDSRDVVEEKSSVKINMEGTSAVPPSAELLVDGTYEPDASVFETEASVLDLKVDTCEDQSVKEQEKEQQMKGPGQDDVVASEPGETSSLEEKKTSTLSTFETATPVVDPEIEKTRKKANAEAQGPIFQEDVVSKAEAFESETKINAGGFENVADPKDLVKENLIVGTSVEGSSAFSLNTDSSDGVPYERLLASDASVLETAASVLAITVDKGGGQSQKEDGKEQDIKCPVQDKAIVSEPGESQSLEEKTVSTMSNLEPAASVVDTEIKKTQKEVDAEALESTDPILQEADVSKPEACEPETSPNASGENLADIRELVIENSMVEVNLEEGTSAITLNADASDNVHCEEPPAPDASVLEAAASVLDLSMDCEDQSGKEDAKEQQMSGPVPDDIVITEPEETTHLEGKEFLTSLTLEKEAPAFDAETEKIEKDVDAIAQESNDPILLSCGSETEISAGSSENLADPRDLFRENSTVGTIVEGTSVVSLNVVDPLAGVLSEKPTAPEVSPLELAMDKGDDHGKKDATEQKMEDALVDEAVVTEAVVAETKSLEESTLSVLEKAAMVVDPETEKTEPKVDEEAQEEDDPIFQEVVVSEPKFCEPETELEAGSSEKVADPRDVEEEISDPPENVPLEKSPTPDALVLETAASNLEFAMDKCEDQSGKEDTKEQEMEDTLLEKGLVPEPLVTENRSSEEGETVPTFVDPPHVKPDTQLNAGSSENAADSEQEKKGTVLDKGLVSEPSVTENPSLEEGEAVSPIVDPPREKPDIQLHTGSSENVADLEEQERKGTAPDKGLVSEPAVTENQRSKREAVCPIADPPHKKPETQINAGPCENAGDSEHVVEERNYTILDKGLVSEFAATENQSSEDRETLVSASSSKNMGDSEHVLKETLVTETNEVIPEVPLDPIPNDDVAHVEPLDLDASLNGSSLGDPSIQMNSALASEGTKESSSALDDKSAQAE
ncbi:P-loop containing nucleoside triphosphate hydrolases superfamily protein [Actinidia rufa]|uniref:P-loop containing nucleoside triphosphate hydrolases superfamily protein n=1 Tax=Actinidia rufa TaxID=165716 RepID=A0A7J0HC45_9ERIC|nr:P-loop containing nucleoside triphosphate hydrolases superfamily protein [Actinidia rufa]